MTRTAFRSSCQVWPEHVHRHAADRSHLAKLRTRDFAEPLPRAQARAEHWLL